MLIACCGLRPKATSARENEWSEIPINAPTDQYCVILGGVGQMVNM